MAVPTVCVLAALVLASSVVASSAATARNAQRETAITRIVVGYRGAVSHVTRERLARRIGARRQRSVPRLGADELAVPTARVGAVLRSYRRSRLVRYAVRAAATVAPPEPHLKRSDLRRPPRPLFSTPAGRHVVVQLSNSDDRETVAVNGVIRGVAGIRETKVFDLGYLSAASCITVMVENEAGGYTWGIDATSDGKSVLHDWAGQVGVVGANNDDHSRPNQLVHILAISPSGGSCASVAQSSPNDPLFMQAQWGLAQIGAPAAWAIGGTKLKMAIVDTGVNGWHEDLLGQVVGEANFTPGPDDAESEEHGTAMAGIAAARFNNAVGISGAAYGVTLLSAKAVGSGANCLDVARAILWAADQGASIISISASGGECPPQADAIDYAWNHDALVVASAGNDHADVPVYPAAYPHVISVAATTRSDTRASFSNFGASWVSIAAPGVEIETTTKDGGYGFVSGTSPAAPLVAASAALIWARTPDANHDGFRNDDVMARIVGSAAAIPGTGSEWASGRLDVAAAADPQSIPGDSPRGHNPPVADFAVSPASPHTGALVTFQATSHGREPIASYSWDLDGDGVPDDAGAGASSASFQYPRRGTYLARLTLTDPAGRVTQAAKPVTVRCVWRTRYKTVRVRQVYYTRDRRGKKHRHVRIKHKRKRYRVCV